MKKTSPLESQVEKYLTSTVRKAGGNSHKVVPTAAGMPDRVVFLPGDRGTIWVELKRSPSHDLDPAQRLWHRRVFEKYGVCVVVLRGSDEVRVWASAGFPVPWSRK